MRLFFILLAVFSMSCSTRSSSITKHLPFMPEGALKKPTSEVGSLNFKNGNFAALGYTFSAFLWPAHPVFGSLESLAKDISTDSRAIDVLTKEWRDLYSRYNSEDARWTSLRCDANLDKVNPDQKVPGDCEKTLGEQGAHEACVCIVSNKPLLAAMSDASLQNRVILGMKITSAIEEDTDSGTNSLLGGASAGTGVGCKVSVASDENGVLKASLRLENFGATDPAPEKIIVYKSVDIPADTKLDDCGLPIETSRLTDGRIINTKYDLQTKLLTFTLISKAETDSPGTRYEFVMERGFVPNGSPELTRFKGDLLKKNCAGQVVGFGSAKFDGIWTN